MGLGNNPDGYLRRTSLSRGGRAGSWSKASIESKTGGPAAEHARLGAYTRNVVPTIPKNLIDAIIDQDERAGESMGVAKENIKNGNECLLNVIILLISFLNKDEIKENNLSLREVSLSVFIAIMLEFNIDTDNWNFYFTMASRMNPESRQKRRNQILAASLHDAREPIENLSLVISRLASQKQHSVAELM